MHSFVFVNASSHYDTLTNNIRHENIVAFLSLLLCHTALDPLKQNLKKQKNLPFL